MLKINDMVIEKEDFKRPGLSLVVSCEGLDLSKEYNDGYRYVKSRGFTNPSRGKHEKENNFLKAKSVIKSLGLVMSVRNVASREWCIQKRLKFWPTTHVWMDPINKVRGSNLQDLKYYITGVL